MPSGRGARRMNVIQVIKGKKILITSFIKNKENRIEDRWLINSQTEELTT